MSDLLNILDLIGLGSATNDVYQLLHGDRREHLSFSEVQARIEQILANHHMAVRADTVVDVLVLHKIIKVQVSGSSSNPGRRSSADLSPVAPRPIAS